MKKYIIISFVMVLILISTGAMAWDIINKPVNSILNSLLNPIAKSVGIYSDNVKMLENGDTWTNVIYDEESRPAAVDVYTVTNKKTDTPESVEVTEIIRKQAMLDENRKPGEYRAFSMWYLQKNDGSVYIYGDNIGSCETDPTCGIIYDKKASDKPIWYENPLLFLPGKLKKGSKWHFVSPTGTEYECKAEKLVKLRVEDGPKLETWLVKYHPIIEDNTEENGEAGNKDEAGDKDKDENEDSSRDFYRWFAPQISFYLRAGISSDSDEAPISILADLLVPMK